MAVFLIYVVDELTFTLYLAQNIVHIPNKAYAGYLSEFLSLVPQDWKALSAAVIGTDVAFGVVFVTVTILAVILVY